MRRVRASRKRAPVKRSIGRHRLGPSPLKGLPQHWKTRIIRWARSRAVVAEVWLFGSRARDMHGSKSDVDLAVVIDGMDYTALFFNWRKLKSQPLPTLPVEVHLERYETDDDGVVASAVWREGRLLYRRKRAAKIENPPRALR